MTAYFPTDMPVPAIEPDTKGFWEGCKQHKLMIQRCKRCATFRHAPVPMCHNCYSIESEYVESEGIGEVYTFIVVQHSTHPATQNVVPYNAAMIQLLDCGGAKIATNILGVKNEDIRIGMRVKVTFEDITQEISLPRFLPLE